MIKVRAVGVAVLAIVAVGVAATGCSAPDAQGRASTPQNPCHGDRDSCEHAGWYVTTVDVNGRQVECLTQNTIGTGYQMSCDWPER